MKNLQFRITSVIIMLLFNNLMYSQTEEAKSLFKVGLVLGGTMSSISSYDGNTRVGVVGGIYLEKSLSEKTSIMTDICYAQRGANGNDNVSSVRLDYITFPVIFQYQISNKFGISAGIAWDDLVGAKGEDISRNDIWRYDWRVPVGVAYNISEKLKCRIEYNFGITDININNNMTNRNNWGSLTIAYVLKEKEQ